MDDILVISTGGTFNKIYNPISGELEIDANSSALCTIAKDWQVDLKIKNIISKDSMDMTDTDRVELLQEIMNTEYNNIVVVHGTDTMELSAEFMASGTDNKSIVFTGAMVPFSISTTGATANLASAIGFLLGSSKNGVYIAMNGIILPAGSIGKDRKKGCFIAIGA